MAVALSLLIVLPTLAQVSGDRTDGRLSVGRWLDVRVADNLADITTDATIGSTQRITGATAFDARDTYFDGTLYVSNQAGSVDATDPRSNAAGDTVLADYEYAFDEAGAYNTILITASVQGTAPGGNLAVLDDGDATNGAEDCAAGVTGNWAIATVKNLRSNTSVTAYLIDAGAGTGTNDPGNLYQGFVTVWDQEDGFDPHNATCADHGPPARFRDPYDHLTATERANSANNQAPQAVKPADGWTDGTTYLAGPGGTTATTNSSAVIPARDGDTLRISVKGVSGSIDVVVDGQGPDIDDAAPEHGGTQKSSTIDLGFTVTDDGSGIRYDGESGDSGDPDLTPHNGDDDNRFDEPITNKGAGPDGILGNADDTGDGDGSTMDITVNFGTAADDMSDVSQYGSNGWTQRMRGVTYDLDMKLVGKSFGSYFWQVTAKDRVGNSATTDADEDKPSDQPYSFKVDDRSPKVRTARTGIGYEPGEGEFKSRSWIALNFENVTKADEFEGGPDRIDAGTVTASDFTVKGNTVVNVVVPGDKKVCEGDDPTTDKEDESAKNIIAFDAGPGDPAEDDDGNAIADAKAPAMCDFEPRARVYLELADALDSDEKPTIQLLGGVLQDIAGNNNVTQSIEDAVDKIAPGVTITITSDTGTTGRAATDKDGSFTVRVESDEDLGRFPRLYFATIKGTDADGNDAKVGAATKLMIDDVTASPGLSLSEKENNIWEKKVDVEDLPGGTADRLMAVIVTATDEASNSGNSAGWKDKGVAGPSSDGDELDFKKLNSGGFLVEVDSTIEAAGIMVLPSTDPGNVDDKTESANPYIQITFSEGNEYGIPADEADDNDADTTEVTHTTADPNIAYTAYIKDAKPLATDSHPDVTIMSLTLNGEDRLAEIVRVKAGEYVLAVTGLAVGEYDIVYTVKDDVGNELDEDEGEFTFEVLERQPYEVELQPGWNLISLPGDPFNPAVGNVIGSDLKADTVLGYQSGEWVTAVKNEDGRWQGTLVDIVGGYGYWVRTTAIETIETVIPPILPTSNLPTVPVISGWNLVGIVDAEQDDAGTKHDADEYFTSLPAWRVAYSFETQQNRWMKLLPNGTDGTGETAEPHMVENGKGYWLWSTRPGTLVP
jgi:hypothetical protein